MRIAALVVLLGSAYQQSIEASHMTNGVVDRTRPLCAYPATAHYTGTGSTDDAKNYRCQ